MLKVYVSYRDFDHALNVAKILMTNGYRPFVPQLNKLIPGLSDDQWVRYFTSWIYDSDALWSTPTARDHELAVAKNFGIPVISNMTQLLEVKLPKYGELLKEFSKQINHCLESSDPNEDWRKVDPSFAVQELEAVIGLQASENRTAGVPKLDTASAARVSQQAIIVATHALKAWDVTREKGAI